MTVKIVQEDIKNWLREIVDRSISNRDTIMDRVPDRADISPGAMARALLTGNATYLLSPADCFDWGSWVESTPISHILVRNQQILVDLIPCSTEEQFANTYGCTIWQMVRLFLLRNEKAPILFNIRDIRLTTQGDVDYGDYLRAGAIKTIGPLLLLSQHHPQHFYCLEIIREPLFDKLSGQKRLFAQCRDRAQQLLASYEKSGLANQRFSMRAHGPASRSALNRNGTWLAHPQAVGRLAYYLAYREIDAEARDPVLEDGVGAGRFELGDGDLLATTADVLGRINVMHQINTAPITGGLGGRYTNTQAEFNALAEAPSGTDLLELARESGDDNTRIGANEGFSEWLVRTLAGAASNAIIEEKIAISRLSNSLEHRKGHLTDQQWDQFLLYRRIREPELALQSNVQSAFERVLARTRGARDRSGSADTAMDEHEYEREVFAYQQAVRDSNRSLKRLMQIDNVAMETQKSWLQELFGSFAAGTAVTGAAATTALLGAPALAPALFLLGYAVAPSLRKLIEAVSPLYPERRDIIYFVENLRVYG